MTHLFENGIIALIDTGICTSKENFNALYHEIS